jgi:hypothetical protein
MQKTMDKDNAYMPEAAGLITARVKDFFQMRGQFVSDLCNRKK